MRLGLVALENDAGMRAADAVVASTSARADAVLAAIREGAGLGLDFLLFAGFTAPEPSPGAEAPVVTALRTHRISAIYERVDIPSAKIKHTSKLSGGDEHSTHRRFYLFDANLGAEHPFPSQVVASSGCANSTPGWNRLRALAHELRNGGARRFAMQEKQGVLLVCGENNYLYQSRGGAIQTRAGLPAWFDYDVVLNPQHSIVTRWEVRDRQRWLSSHTRGQLAVSCTNYLPEQRWHRWTLHAAKDQATVLSGQSNDLHRGRGFILGVIAV